MGMINVRSCKIDFCQKDADGSKVKMVSKTHQSFKDECDIGHILQKYQVTGVVSHLADERPNLGYVDPIEFHEAMNLVNDAKAAFDQLPALVRQRLDYDPANLLPFLEDEANADFLREQGLIKKAEKAVEVIQKVEIVNPAVLPSETKETSDSG